MCLWLSIYLFQNNCVVFRYTCSLPYPYRHITHRVQNFWEYKCIMDRQKDHRLKYSTDVNVSQCVFCFILDFTKTEASSTVQVSYSTFIQILLMVLFSIQQLIFVLNSASIFKYKTKLILELYYCTLRKNKWEYGSSLRYFSYSSTILLQTPTKFNF